MRKSLIAGLLAALVALACAAACSAAPAKSTLGDAQASLPSKAEPVTASATSSAPSSSSAPSAVASSVAFNLAEVPPYAGKPSVEVNGNVPFFTLDDLARGAFEEYSPLDQLGRCGVAFALIGRETMPHEERGSIGMVKPSGWHTVRYDGLVDGNYLYNRCHLIAFSLAGENENERNLITGTRSMNTQGMLPYEERVADYIDRTGNHVLYRSTPVFEGDELVARGVLLEAQSVEDGGAGVRFCAWCYNVEPGVEIDYATGESVLASSAGAPSSVASERSESGGLAEPADDAVDVAEVDEAAEAEVRTYVLNTNTRKFHHPDCSSVGDMAEHNKRIVEATRQQVIDEGFEPCKRCNP